MDASNEHCFRPLHERRAQFTPDELAFVLTALPKGGRIHDAYYFDNYNLPCPIRIEAVLVNGEPAELVLRKARHGSAAIEARVLAWAADHDLPVPKVLAGPTRLADGHEATVLTVLRGVTLQKLSMGSAHEQATARKLLVQAIGKLSSLTAAMLADPLARQLPRRPLTGVLNRVRAPTNRWLADPDIRRAVKDVEARLERAHLPLVFTNGDYQPGNFLTDGERVTGFLDFELCGFEDPLFGIAKYPVYDLHPLHKGGFVAEFLRANAVDSAAFSTRVVLFALEVLRKEVPFAQRTEGQERYRSHLLGLIAQAQAWV